MEDMTEEECNAQGGTYQGDDTLCVEDACQGPDEDTFGGIPAVTEWGLVVMVLMGMAAGTVMFRKWRQQTAHA